MRIGFGYDSHVFDEERPLKLGGVLIPDAPGLKGHSDADALIHAVIDAIYGAAALGDIGSHFPDTDPKWKGADSAELLRAAVADVHAAGFAVGNVDVRFGEGQDKRENGRRRRGQRRHRSLCSSPCGERKLK